ncbi:molybdate ABC transporter substrate-binding protein [Paenibacillus faecalis]|uniref:molybdate ABC transporter substrate-binding protein n=1 Tax=Paenibacillus faecalis TaxID=2079532 RepID=UPI000D10BA50|nr:molybdate ABC transporter substrate-binding protein [Paenibacillus faecalis]
MKQIGKSTWIAWMLVLSVIIMTGCMSVERQNTHSSKQSSTQIELTVSAAASLKSGLEEAAALFESRNPDIKIQFNFGGSGSLQQQIEQGAPVDLFFSAAKEPMEQLVQKGLIERSESKVMLHNRLVLIVPKGDDSIHGLQDLIKPEVQVIAIGQLDTVPAGAYGKEVLEGEGLWNKVESKAVYAKDVTQVLSYVTSGNADAGFVYASDAIQSSDVKVSVEIDPASHTLIEYPAAVIKMGKNPEEARKLLDFLQTDEARDIFEKYGFILPEGSI